MLGNKQFSAELKWLHVRVILFFAGKPFGVVPEEG